MKIKHLPILGLALGLGVTTAGARDRSFGDELPEFLEQFDVNEDGVIDEEERQAVREAREARHEEWIAQWDTDDDGVLSDEEKEAARDAIRAKIEAKRTERFNELAGEDGCLSLDEFAAIPGLDGVDPARVEALFNRMDADDSGDVKLDEFLARLRHHRRPGGHHPPRRPRPPHRPNDGEGDGGNE